MKAVGRFERIVLPTLGGIGLFFLVAPMFIIALASLDSGEFFQFPPADLSLRWYRELLEDDEWVSSIRFSLTISALIATMSTIVGGLAGIAVARAPTIVRRVLFVLLVAPLAVPAIVLALALYGQALEYRLVGSMTSFVVAGTLLYSPLVAILVASAALGVDPRLEFASLSCGAGPWRTIARITVPLVAPAAIAGGVLAFLLAMDEVVVFSFLVGPDATPVAVRIFLQVQTGTSPITTAAATLLMLASILTIGVAVLIYRGAALAARRVATPDVTFSPGRPAYRARLET